MNDTIKRSFASFEKIDAHLHFNAKNNAVVKLAEQYGFTLITVNVEFPEFGSIAAQREFARELMFKTAGSVRFVTTFSLDRWESPEWLADTLSAIERDMQQGALAVKIWKNLGMEIRDKEGRMLLIDDDRLDPLFTYLENRGFPVVMHQAEPRNCWLPLNEMTMKYDREYFARHPHYHMYWHSEMPSYEKLLAARDRRLSKNPALRTVQAHLASLEWSVDALADFLERFPNAVVDTAARMNHLMYQAGKDWEKVVAFFVNYQDRILYASDFFITPENAKQAAQELEAIWLRDWLFLSQSERMETDDFDGGFYGLGLNEAILRKIYFENAQRVFKLYAFEKVGLAHV